MHVGAQFQWRQLPAAVQDRIAQRSVGMIADDAVREVPGPFDTVVAGYFGIVHGIGDAR